MSWQGAVGRVDITPPAGAPMGGYGVGLGSSPRTASGTFSPLTARAVALWDSGRPHVLVSADLLGWSAATAAVIRQRVTAATGLPAARLLLVASHTHNGPALPGVSDPWTTYAISDTAPLAAYERTLVTAVTGLVTSLLGAPRQPVTVDYRTTSASFSTNREGLPYTEEIVPVLVARDIDGRPLAVLFGFGTHPVCAGWQGLWDGDYPAVAAAAVEAALPGALAAFLPGAAGDQNPVGDSGWGLRAARGVELASAVVTAAATPGRALTGVTSARLTTVPAPLEITPTAANLALARSFYAARAEADPLGWEVRHARAMVALIDSGVTLPTSLPVPLEAWTLAGSAPLRLVFVGGELVSGYAVHFRGQYGDDGVWAGGYGAGLVAYLPSDELLPPLRQGGSYAGGWNTDHPGIAGGAMCAYGPIAHFRAGSNGIESALANALTAILA